MTNLILFLTLLAICWYSYETRRLADLTAKQIKINIKPIITIMSSIDKKGLKLKNIGKSPALNILVRDIVRIKNENNQNDRYVLKFTKITVCGSNEEKAAGITPYDNDQAITDSKDATNAISSFLVCNSVASGQNYELIVDYEDIEKGKWRSISIADNEDVHFKEVRELS